MSENKLKFVGFEIVDENGEIIGTDPKDFPVLMARITEAVFSIRLGQNCKLKNVNWNKLQ